MIALLVLFSLFSLSTFGFVVASSDNTYITIRGCDVSGVSLLPGQCSRDGYYFCPESSAHPPYNRTPWDTLNYRCDQESNCCPSGFHCNELDECKLNTVDCSNFTTKSSCTDDHENGVCFWIDTDAGAGDDGFCTSNANEGSCSVYINQLACENDTYTFGQNGIGTEVCEKYSSLGHTIKNCRCVWDSGNCSLTYNSGETSYSGIRDSFDCFKTFSTGECINGKQNISWIARVDNREGVFGQDVIDASGCMNGARDRVCGAASIKLPGFSTYALIAVVVLIVAYYIYYLSKQKNKKNKKSKRTGMGAKSRTLKGTKK